MAAFDFKALDQKGRPQKGVLEADSARQVRQQIRDKGWTPLEVTQASEKQSNKNGGGGGFRPRGSRLGAADLALLTRQIATLIQSGIPVEETLSAVASQSEKAKVRSMMLAVRAKVLEGYSLADSLSEFPSAFPELYRSTVAAGEHAGHLDLVLNRLADYTEQRQMSRQKIQLAAIYPIILTFVAFGIVGFLLGYVVPDIIKVFVSKGQALPALTQVILALSDFVANYALLIVAALVIAFFSFTYAMKKEGFRLQVHRQLLHLPFTAKMSRGINTARFASTLSILNSSGVPLVDAMRIAGEVLSNQWLKLRVAEAAQKVREGGSLYKCLEQTGYFPPMMIHMIASGEASGELGEMLERTASSQENDLQSRIATMVGLFEPLMLLVMGGVVLIIVMAIMLPILSMSDLVG
ncbi:type II secretion system inner membrane protein GspF [Hahella aquimaris]|uniref:General secretion pathway protein F n=1 Tax=Hahella chejuensis (strain KCTC 2396) TaxID=349521 RepID=Q2SFB8_HAHCH|nr:MULTISPECIES: type II secretion system inner membrane protein GspF [Hahella]ABC30656.1 general secretion pathway protein F [Hahella chejuensis KCTC 2396]WLQ15833.1 type II secretion system inner membrane protein GspF [Hahella sp. HNIBRBA332]